MLPYQTLPSRPALQTTDNRDSGRGRGAGDLRLAPTVCVASVSRAAPSDLRSPQGDLLHPGSARQLSGAGLWRPACPPGVFWSFTPLVLMIPQPAAIASGGEFKVEAGAAALGPGSL